MTLRSCSAGYRRLCGLAQPSTRYFCRRCVANKMHSFVVAGTIIASDAVTVCSPKATPAREACRCQTHWYYSLPGSGWVLKRLAECYRKIVHLIVELIFNRCISVALSTPLPVISSFDICRTPEPRFCPPQTLPAANHWYCYTQRCGNRMRARFFTFERDMPSPLAWVMAMPLFSRVKFAARPVAWWSSPLFPPLDDSTDLHRCRQLHAVTVIRHHLLSRVFSVTCALLASGAILTVFVSCCR